MTHGTCAPPRGISPRRVGDFLRDNLALAPLLPAMALLGAVAHTCAHGIALVFEHGSTLGLDLQPAMLWREHLPASAGPIVRVAPTILSGWLALISGLVGMFLVTRDTGSRLFVLLAFFLPLLDVSTQAGGLFCGNPRSDWYHLLRGWEPQVAVLFGLLVAVFGEIGLRLFQRSWPGALSPAEFTVGYLALLGLPWLIHLPWLLA